MLQEIQTKPAANRHAVRDHARALARVLADEFGVPFVFYDGATGAIFWEGQGERREDEPRNAPLDGDLLANLMADGRPRVVPQPDGGYQLSLLIHQSAQPALIAVGLVASLATSCADDPKSARLPQSPPALADPLPPCAHPARRTQADG